VGLTQAQVSEVAGVAEQTVSRLERGHQAVVSLDLAERLSKAVQAPLAELLGVTAPTPPAGDMRPMERRIIKLLKALDEEALKDVYVGLRRLLGVRARPRRR
jgi:transcriptional regulator with XRE-family HTH domain